MIENYHISVVVPCYNESKQILKVLESMPVFVDTVIVVDDCSTDKTIDIVKNFIKAGNERIRLICHSRNLGVGACIHSGYEDAIRSNSDLIGVMAGDFQMDPAHLINLIQPFILDKEIDYVKDNRLKQRRYFSEIPKKRLIGNSILTILTRLASGYWHIGDSQTGYTVAKRDFLEMILTKKLYARYGVPNDIILRASEVGAKVLDVPSKPRYGVGEKSKMRPNKVVFPILTILTKGFFKRIFFKDLLIDFNPSSIAYIIGLLNIFIGTLWIFRELFLNYFLSTSNIEIQTIVITLTIGTIHFLLGIVFDMLRPIINNKKWN
jgi:glycosyltransferase involved in cell wall biosynthesis